MSRTRLLTALQELYDRWPESPENRCGTCLACCRPVLDRHQVSELELALLEERTSAEAVARFRAYLARERDDAGQLRYDLCPNYADGCQVYSVRPFSCRTFGHYREEQTRLPDGCVFVGSETVFPQRAYFTAVPRSRELRALAREFELFLASPRTAYAATRSEAPQAVAADFFDEGDELDRALLLQSQGRLEEALDMALSAPQGAFRDYSLALLCSALERHEEAARLFAGLAERVPARAEFHYYAGYHALLSGRPGEALARLERAVEAEPEYAMAWGFLGYLALQQGAWQQASEAFAAGRRADPSNPFFALRWAVCQRQLGESAGVEEALQQAAGEPATAEEALRLLS